MADATMMTYQRIKRENPKNKKCGGAKTFLSGAAGFLFASAFVYDGMSPLGLSYLTKERRFCRKTMFTAIFVILANLLSDNFAYAAKYIAAEAIYLSVLFVLEKGIRLSFKAAVFAAAGALAVSGGMILYWQGFGFRGFMHLFGEILVMASGASVFNKIKQIDFFDFAELKKMSPDKRFAVVISAGFLLMGAKRFYIGSGISVMNVCAALFILVASAGAGASFAAVFGIWTGFACGIGTDFFMPLVGTFGFCGFLCGLFSKFGKAGAAIGLILANAVLIVYTNNAIEPMLKIYEILLGTALFVFVPNDVVEVFGDILKISVSEKEKISELKKSIKQRLKKISSSFKDMADTLEELSEKKQSNPSELAEIFDKAADKICVNCRRSPICWGKDFNSTYKSLFSLLESFEKKGTVDEGDFGEYLNIKCLNKEKLLSEINYQLELYKSELVWKSRLWESRELACRQISGMSEIIDDVACEIDKGFEKDFVPEKQITSLFKKSGIKIKYFTFEENKNGRLTAKLLVKASDFEKNGSEKIRKMLGRFSGKDFIFENLKSMNKKYKLVSFSEKKSFYVEHGSASVGLSEKNGDSYMFFELECGKYVILLSDGMGTGLKASKESKAITELLNTFLKAGFNKNLALKLINTVMIMKSENDEFATVDMCVIDLYTGEAEFLKSGAEPSYIKEGDKVEIVTGNALPVGIIVENEPESFKRTLKDGDFVVMTTDGILSRENGSEWIKDYLKNNFNQNPQETAKDILNKAAENNGGKILDDITVLSVKVCKRSALKSA